jgi:prepilin-type N-terminal cleavage/methylation domain-containing protein
MRRHRGFTLIELLVVIAVIAVLMAILMPALQRAKRQASAINCMANVKTLATGWYMYATDNDGRIMSCRMDTETPGGTVYGWIGTPRTEAGTLCTQTQTVPPVTDEDEIRGIMLGALYRYAPNPKSFHCPSDTIRISKHDRTRVFVRAIAPEVILQQGLR